MSWMIDDLWSSRYPVHPASRLLMDCLMQDLRPLFLLRAFGDALPNPLETLVLISHRCDIPIYPPSWLTSGNPTWQRKMPHS